MSDAMPGEQWLPIEGFPRYEVSDQGRVRSLDRPSTDSHPDRRRQIGGIVRGRVLKPATSNQWGHQFVSLHENGSHPRYVHRLVLAAFVGPCPEGQEGCHNNGDPTDNRLSNLRWDTHSENQYDKGRHGTDTKRNRTYCPRNHQLGAPNNVASFARAGRRTCLACARARAYIHRYAHLTIEADLQRISDSYYAEIVRNAA